MKKKTIPVLSMVLLFGIVYCLISLVNHYFFRTYALDLGMFNHALYDFSHFRGNTFTLSAFGQEVNYFGDHFSPITILYTPFYWIFGSYTLLILQIVAVLAGGYGVYKYAEKQLSNSTVALILLIHFYCIWGIYSALSYDFHNNVIAAMMVPWLAFFYTSDKKKSFAVLFVLALLTKENISLWLGFIMIGLTLGKLCSGKFTWKQVLKFEFAFTALSFAYFILIISLVMPALRDGEGFNQLDRYNHLGSSLFEIIGSILSNPAEYFSMFFTEPYFDRFNGIGLKEELHLMVLASGGFALLFYPRFLLMLIPIYAQKLLSWDDITWGMSYQYSIEFVPIISLALVHVLKWFKNGLMQNYFMVILTVHTALATFLTIEVRSDLWFDKTNTAFYDESHYSSPFNIELIHQELDKIPDEAIVSTCPNLAPHLADREKIYHFPIINEADYIILLKDHVSFYPLDKASYLSKLQELKQSTAYSTYFEEEFLIILKKQGEGKSAYLER